MTRACSLKSRMKRKFHVRFGTGGGAGDCPTDHNWAHLFWMSCRRDNIVQISSKKYFNLLQNYSGVHLAYFYSMSLTLALTIIKSLKSVLLNSLSNRENLDTLPLKAYVSLNRIHLVLSNRKDPSFSPSST